MSSNQVVNNHTLISKIRTDVIKRNISLINSFQFGHMNNVILKNFFFYICMLIVKKKKDDDLLFSSHKFKKKTRTKLYSFFSFFSSTMFLDDDGNHDTNILPFADCELATEFNVDLPIFQKSIYNKKTKTKKKSTKQKKSNEKYINPQTSLSHIYFENTEEKNNFLKFIPYTGPSNTLHLGRQLYLPQLISNTPNDSTVSFQQFIEDYDRVITSLTSSLETMSLSIYLRFGISYIIHTTMANQSIPLQDFALLRNQGLKNANS